MLPLKAVFRPLQRTVTYTRWLHLLVGGVFAAICLLVFPGTSATGPVSWAGFLALPVPLLIGLAMVPVVRTAEGVQVRAMVLPCRAVAHDGGPGGTVEGAGPWPADLRASVGPALSWGERGRTALWLLVRVLAGVPVLLATVWLPALSVVLVVGPGGWFVLLAPLPLVALAAVVVAAGAVLAQAACWLLAPSAAERVAALEARTERLLEHNRLARELHDSIGHALTIAVVQAGAARAAGSAEFTERALAAIEDTGRQALEDLERVLRLLRPDADGAGAAGGRRPDLTDVAGLFASARAAGAPVVAEVDPAVREVPGPLSREGYRIVQEALTNVLRHAGQVPVTVRIAVAPAGLVLDVRNPLPTPGPGPVGGGQGGG
ncbi:histidine kinase, partial [Streptomyces sp. HSW2009]|uniref:sensor histidine kinase n=1 Tax=Streptomyces sp. HSW2009 TaxID=3142890 RepID=UPI0032EC1144